MNRTPEQIDQIVTLWNSGKSATEIGKLVGSSRVAIAGLVWRQRSKGVVVRGKCEADCIKLPPKPKAQREARVRLVVAQPPLDPVVTAKIAWNPLDGSAPIKGLAPAGCCKWPVEIEGVYHSCGLPITIRNGERPRYCVTHARMSANATQPNDKRIWRHVNHLARVYG